MEQELSELLKKYNYIGIQMTKNVVGQFEIDARIKNQPVRLVVDTGASHTVINSETAERLALAAADTGFKAGGVGTSDHDVKYTIIDALEFTGLQTGPLIIVVMDLSHVNQTLILHGAKAVDGVMGGDLMSKKNAVIDYPNATIFLLKN